MIREVTAIAFDEELPPEVFVLELPEGETFAPLEPPGTEYRLPVTELVERAGFRVFVPDRVPSDWELMTHYTPARQRPRVHEMLHLHYQSRDGTASLGISQLREEDDEQHHSRLRDERWETLERDGVELSLRRRAPDWFQPQLHLVRDGTALMLSSNDLSDDELIALALSLRPASGRSPLA